MQPKSLTSGQNNNQYSFIPKCLFFSVLLLLQTTINVLLSFITLLHLNLNAVYKVQIAAKLIHKCQKS